MKSLLALAFSCCIWFVATAQSQAPSLDKLPTLPEKIEALRNYCNVLLTETFENRQLIATAKKGLAMCPADSVKYRSMFCLFAGCAYENIKEYDSALYYLEKSAGLARSINKLSYEITALSRLNYVYDYLQQTQKRKATLDRMLQLADTSSKPEIKQLAVDAMAGYYVDVNDYAKAIEFKERYIALYKEALRTDSLITDPINIGYAYSNIAKLFNQLGQYQKAIEYQEEARPYIGNRALQGNEETFYTNYIQAFLGLHQTDSARHYYQLIYQAMAGRDTLYITLTTANYLFAQYFLEQHQTDSVFKYAIYSKRFGRLAPEKSAYIKASEILGNLYFLQNNYKASLAEMSTALQNDFEFDRSTLANIHKTMSASFARLQQWDSAYTHFEIYSRINDSLQTAASSKNFADAEARFQNREKQQQLLVKNMELAAGQKQKLWLLAGLALLVLVILLLAVIYRNKRKAATVLDDKNKTLQQLNNQLEEANQTKAKLFSIISHDLRSPISQVYQFLKLQQLNPMALSIQQKEALSYKIQEATGSLLETMEDLLLWSKTQMNAFSSSLETIPLAPLLQNSLQLLQLNIDAKQLNVSMPVDEDITVFTDPYFLQTIVRNLLQNAVKASPVQETILIQATTQHNKVQLSIQNKGGAFTQQQYESIIADHATTTSLNGLGLKLVDELSKKINAGIVFQNPDEKTTVAVIELIG